MLSRIDPHHLVALATVLLGLVVAVTPNGGWMSSDAAVGTVAGGGLLLDRRLAAAPPVEYVPPLW